MTPETTEKTIHTPTPWTYTIDEGQELKITAEECNPVVDGCGCCGSPWCKDEDAEFIVRACNAHDDLVTAAQAALSVLENLELNLEQGLSSSGRLAVEALHGAIEKALTPASTSPAQPQ